MIKKLIRNRVEQRKNERRSELYRKLVRHEAQVGATVFGKVPNGHRREFFCLDEHSWVWHEEWVDHEGNNQVLTTRYDVRPSGVFKVQHGQYRSVSNDEATRFFEAVNLYEKRVYDQIYAGVV